MNAQFITPAAELAAIAMRAASANRGVVTFRDLLRAGQPPAAIVDQLEKAERIVASARP